MMEGKIVSILFCLFSIPSCLGSANWIIIEELAAEDQYFELKFFHIKNDGSTDSGSTDGFSKKTPTELKGICSQLKNAKIYQRIPLVMQKFPEPEILREIPALEDESVYKYTDRSLKLVLGQIIGEIPVFPCQTHENRMYWLTYGFSDSNIFLLREVDNGAAVSFVGKSVLIPKVDVGYHRGDILDAYFWMTLEKGLKQDVQLHPTNQFASSALFHLCCMVHAAQQIAHPGQKSFTINYANSDAVTKSFSPMILKTQSDEYKKVELRAIGCAVNRHSEKDEIDFYIRAHPQNSNALFILNHETVSGERRLVVTGRVSGIPRMDQYSIYYI